MICANKVGKVQNVRKLQITEQTKTSTRQFTQEDYHFLTKMISVFVYQSEKSKLDRTIPGLTPNPIPLPGKRSPFLLPKNLWRKRPLIVTRMGDYPRNLSSLPPRKL